jgi:uncharacterized membrane protein YhaH (DUF805 family)
MIRKFVREHLWPTQESRCGRVEFGFSIAVLFFIWAAAISIATNMLHDRVSQFLELGSVISAVIWVFGVLVVRRLTDMGKPRINGLRLIIPFYGIVFLGQLFYEVSDDRSAERL